MCQVITPRHPERAESPPRDGMDALGVRLARKFAAPANGHLQLLAWAMRTAARVADEFLSEHPEGCGCDYCGLDNYIDALKEDVAGLRWLLGRDCGGIESLVVDLHDLDGGTAGADLRTMAALADRIDAAYAAEYGAADEGSDPGEDADTPVVVGGEGGAP